MKFILQMAARETRAAWRRLLFFFVCIAVGVAAIVALRSVIHSVRDVLGTEGRALVAADVTINTTRDWTPGATEIIDRRLAEANAVARTETISTPTMARPGDESRQVARMVAVALGLREPPEPLDASDALALALAVAWDRTGVFFGGRER